MLGQSFAYAYDLIGNRTAASRDNEEMSYTANTLNQYTQRTVGDLIDVLGSAETGTTVTVNNQAASRYEKYWHCGIGVTNSSDAVWQEINVVGVYNPPGTNDPDIVTSETGHVFVAKTPETFTYDNDGNLLKDGRFNYTWDCENRLISAETLTNLPASVPRVRVEFEYDYMSRRISKTVGRRTGGGLWQLMGSNTFLYDSWNLIKERSTLTATPSTNLYVWGLDLSGSLQGAGGIGGLLAAQLGTNSVFYTYDGNGNVSELINTLDGTIAAHYEYSPFGEVLVATGDLASKNPFQFSTKYFDAETGLNYYGYRYYSPSLGRWLNRDPIGEQSFFDKYTSDKKYEDKRRIRQRALMPLYIFVKNGPVLFIDPLGLDLKNDCDRPVWVYINGWEKLDPGKTWPGDTDGVSWGDWGDHANQAFKWTDCFDATVTCPGGKCHVVLTYVGDKNIKDKSFARRCICNNETLAWVSQSEGGWISPTDPDWPGKPKGPWPSPPKDF